VLPAPPCLSKAHSSNASATLPSFRRPLSVLAGGAVRREVACCFGNGPPAAIGNLARVLDGTYFLRLSWSTFLLATDRLSKNVIIFAVKVHMARQHKSRPKPRARSAFGLGLGASAYTPLLRGQNTG
jgi:hypothetical protein